MLSILPFPAQTATQVLHWSGYEKDPHPCLYLTTGDVTRIRQTRLDLESLRQNQSLQLAQDGLEKLIDAALIADDASAKKTVIAEALKALDQLIAKIPETTFKNVGPHNYSEVFGKAVGLADAALAGTLMTPDERTQMLAKLAQVGYLINDPKYWNPEAGKGSLCPNMYSTADGYRLTIAALIPSHPMAKTWFDAALRALKQELDDWMDPAGGMLESPHYSMVIFDQLLGAFLIAKHAGAPDSGHLFDPKLRKAMEWFGNISTPRDPRNDGFRRWPTIGHTYVNERTTEFGVMASLWQEKDPAFAATMEWMHREHGCFGEPGILSYYTAFMGYRSYFRNSGIQPKVPAWTSTVYPETGVLLRNTIGSHRESTLYMIAGRNHSHYYNDSGSITLWGKGRELCDEESYQFPRNKISRKAHSMPDRPATFSEESVMALQEFSTTGHLDYVRGNRRGWQRQIAFVKDADPLGPNYFVIADTLDAKSVPTTWRLYLAAAQITPTASGVTVVGRDDVDMDVIFLRPAALQFEIQSNHIAAAVSASGTVSALLYPRLKTEQPPQVVPLAAGRGVKVVSSAGADYVFLAPEPFTFAEGDVSFTGKVGVIKIREGKQIKAQPGPCPVAAGWEGGDRELRMIRWKGPQYPAYKDILTYFLE
jgi:hypothetical protein